MKQVLAALLLLATATAASADTLADVKSRGELRWGADIQGGEPYVYEDPNDPQKIIGFEVEIAEGLAKRLGVKSTYVQVNWSNLVPSLERGDMDVILNGFEATADRRERLLLSHPYYTYAETLAVHRGSPLRYDDLRGKRIGSLNQTYAWDLIRASSAEAVPYEGVQEPYLDLAAGRLDGVLLEDVIANRYGCPLPEVECVSDPVALGTYVVGMRKDDAALQAAIDAALDDMRASGELRAILEKARLWNARQEGPRPELGAKLKKRAFDLTQLRLFIAGAGVTLVLSVLSFVLAMLLGVLLAVARVYGGGALSIASATYVEIFRGTPVLLQLYVLYFALAPVLRLNAFQAAVLGLGLNYAAYEAEIYRGALTAIARGQTEAAHSLGLSTWQTLRHVLMPQALRMALPAMTNDFVALLKDSSVVSVITVVELTKRMTIAGVDLNDWVKPGVACAALYFTMSFPLAQMARWLERRLTR